MGWDPEGQDLVGIVKRGIGLGNELRCRRDGSER